MVHRCKTGVTLGGILTSEKFVSRFTLCINNQMIRRIRNADSEPTFGEIPTPAVEFQHVLPTYVQHSTCFNDLKCYTYLFFLNNEKFQNCTISVAIKLEQETEPSKGRRTRNTAQFKPTRFRFFYLFANSRLFFVMILSLKALLYFSVVCTYSLLEIVSKTIIHK